MGNINTADDVREWARTIVEAKGEKYTPLAKGDLYAIAKYVLECGMSAEKPPEQPDVPSPEAIQTAVSIKDIEVEDGRFVSEDEFRRRGCSTSPSEQDHTIATKVMRCVGLHDKGVPVQKAYDEFLEWSKSHPKEASVMDFSSGVRSNNAAFAYWLTELVTVKIPTTTTALM